jgi:tellurite resistance protein TerB
MAQRCDRPGTTNSERASDYRHNRDDTVLQALVTAGAFVALADGRVKTVEREELMNFIERQRFVPSISRQQIGEAFDHRVRQLEDRDSADVIAEALQPLAGLSLASAVIRTATQVAAADQHIHPGEVRALKLIRSVLAAEQKPGSDSLYLEMDEPEGSSELRPFGSDSSESCLRSSGSQAMGADHIAVDSRSPEQIARAIVKVNESPEMRQAGLDVLWKLYYASLHTLTRPELEREFGVLADHFGLYCRRVAEELGATGVDALPLVTCSREGQGFEIITLKPSVVAAIQSYAFSEIGSVI